MPQVKVTLTLRPRAPQQPSSPRGPERPQGPLSPCGIKAHIETIQQLSQPPPNRF